MEQGKIVYLIGDEDNKEDFKSAENFLIQGGDTVLNPTELDNIVQDLTPEQIMRLHYRLIDFSDAVFMVRGWQECKEANAELTYAKSLGKKVMYQSYYRPFRREKSDE